MEKGPVKPEPEGGKPNKTQQLKKVFKEYGAVGVSFHIGISLMSLGMFYLLLSRYKQSIKQSVAPSIMIDRFKSHSMTPPPESKKKYLFLVYCFII